jgi:hypothetical protein
VKRDRLDDFYLGSKIASMIDGFISMEGLEAFLNPKVAIAIDDEYEVFMTFDIDAIREEMAIQAFVYLCHLGSWEEFNGIMHNNILSEGPMAHMAIDDLAADAVIKLKGQITAK